MRPINVPHATTTNRTTGGVTPVRPPETVRWGAAFGSAAGKGFTFGPPIRRPKASDWG